MCHENNLTNLKFEIKIRLKIGFQKESIDLPFAKSQMLIYVFLSVVWRYLYNY